MPFDETLGQQSCMIVTAAQASLPQGQQKYLLLRMFDYVSLDQHTSLKPSSYVCNSFTRLEGMLQYPCFKCCFEPTGMCVAVAPDHLARRLQLNSTSMHVCKSCIYQHICLNQLQLTNNHICSCVAEPTGIYVTLTSDPQMSLCSYPINGLVSTIAPDHHACILQLHLTSSHVFIWCILSACMSVTVSAYQHPCILHLHPIISHVCNNCTWPFPLSLTVASIQQSYHSANFCLQAFMSDTLAPHQHTYFYSNVQPSVLFAALATDHKGRHWLLQLQTGLTNQQ